MMALTSAREGSEKGDRKKKEKERGRGEGDRTHDRRDSDAKGPGFVFVKREIALSRQCRDLLTDNSVELIVPSW